MIDDVKIARLQGYAYVWGRQDAGEGARDTGLSIQFGDAFALRRGAYDSGRSCSTVPLRAAWREWSTTNRLTYHTRDGWREITVITEGANERVVDRVTSDAPALF